MKYNRRDFLSLTGMTMAAVSLRFDGYGGSLTNSGILKRELVALEKAGAWINSPALTAEKLTGKIVLVNFWTYSCINWMRTLPYTRAWSEKYKDNGLVTISVHAPEFEFEKDLENVRRASKDLNVNYAIATDNDHKIWQAFDNNYWPALYLVDAKGIIRYHQFGEGEYEKSEKFIQILLVENGAAALDNKLVSIDATGIERTADWNNLKSDENYLGFMRTQNFASPNGFLFGSSKMYTAPANLILNEWALTGDWKAREESILLNKSKGRIIYRFHARDLHLVMGPAATGSAIPFKVTIDGKAPGEAHGSDTDEGGNGEVKEHRLYQLIRQQSPVVDRIFEIEFLEPGVEAFSFTFG